MEDKAHQGDFYVLDISFAQRVHKLLLPRNSVVPKWNPRSLGVCRRRWMDRELCRQLRAPSAHRLCKEICSPLGAPLGEILPQLPLHSIKLGTNWGKKKGHNENLMSNFLQDQYFLFCRKIWDNGKWKLNLEVWNMEGCSFSRVL